MVSEEIAVRYIHCVFYHFDRLLTYIICIRFDIQNMHALHMIFLHYMGFSAPASSIDA